jgi:tetratricopeptide (TPR) repeat protein
VILFVVAAAIAWRPLAAWCADNAGNRALARGQTETALTWFDRSLQWEPRWRLLHEDRGRALQAHDPAAALPEFDYAGCGAPCEAEAGDALVRTGRADEAVERYVRAHAARRVFTVASDLARAGRYEVAVSLVRLLIAQLHDNFLERSDLASSYAGVGSLELDAAAAQRARAHALRAEAIADFATASQLSPFNEGYLLSYASAQQRFGDRRAAARAYERVLELHPNQPDAEAALHALHDAGDAPDAPLP